MPQGYETQRYCPDDQTPLHKREERGVVVDECPRCGVVVLDRGELPQIIATIASVPGFHAPVRSHAPSHGGFGFGGHRQRHHRTSSGLFGSFFGSS